MVERHPYKVDVAGSNPVLPTIILKSLVNFKFKNQENGRVEKTNLPLVAFFKKSLVMGIGVLMTVAAQAKMSKVQFSTEDGYLAKACDIWSLGVTLFVFFNGKLPFEGESELEIDIKAKNNEIIFDEKIFPSEVISLIN